MEKNLKDILKIKERTLTFLQRKTGITRYRLDLIAEGKRSPTLIEIKKIAEALEVTIDDLIKNSNIKEVK